MTSEKTHVCVVLLKNKELDCLAYSSIACKLDVKHTLCLAFRVKVFNATQSSNAIVEQPRTTRHLENV